MQTSKEKLEKRVGDHTRTIGIFLASSNHRLDHETEREFKERLISLGAQHAFSKVNIPLMKAIMENENELS